MRAVAPPRSSGSPERSPRCRLTEPEAVEEERGLLLDDQPIRWGEGAVGPRALNTNVVRTMEYLSIEGELPKLQSVVVQRQTVLEDINNKAHDIRGSARKNAADMTLTHRPQT